VTRVLPSAPSSADTHDRCRAAARAAAAVLSDPWIARQLDRGTGGLLRSDSGDSTEFHDQRPYVPGDDPRRINWAAYARSGQLTLKLFRQEGRPLIDCLIDTSPSMWHPADKAERCLELLYFIIESATAQGAGLHVWALCGSQAVPLPVPLLNTGARWVEQLPTSPAAGLDPLSTRGVPLRSGSRRILLSDLLFPIEPEDLIRPLAARDGGVSILAPWHPTEENPAWRGVCHLDDSESQAALEAEFDPRATATYRTAYHRHFENWNAAATRHAADLSRIPCGGNLASALAPTRPQPSPGASR